jgi:hydroxymethylbilane synthase
MNKIIRIGTRESQLAVWQATLVKDLLAQHGFAAELEYIKSEGDIDLQTPLYAMGVQGVFTRSLDIALLNNRIDIAVHSMKDVPTQLPQGIEQAAVLKRASHKDVFIPHPELANPESIFGRGPMEINQVTYEKRGTKESSSSKSEIVNTGEKIAAIIATSSVRRKAQWLHRYPHHRIETLRGNVNTRLRKLSESNWQGAIFAAAGLERIGLLPARHIELDWMLPAPAQGAIMVVSRGNDTYCLDACANLNDEATALCTKIERDFLKTLQGGCSAPISAFAEIRDGEVHFRGNIFSPQGKLISEAFAKDALPLATEMGARAATHLLNHPNPEIAELIRDAIK